MLAGGLDDAGRDFVLVEPAVSVSPTALGRNHVRRIARDEIERFPVDRVEEAALATFDVREAVQRRVELRVGQRTRVDVGSGDVSRVPRGQECVHAATGTDVECAFDLWAWGQRVEHACGRRVGGDVVRRIVAVAGVAVGGEQHVPDRQDAYAGIDLLADGSQTGRRQRLDAAFAKCADRVTARNRQLEKEESHDGRDGRVRKTTFVDGGVVLIAGVRVLAQQSVQRVLGVAHAAKRCAEVGRGSLVGNRELAHGSEIMPVTSRLERLESRFEAGKTGDHRVGVAEVRGLIAAGRHTDAQTTRVVRGGDVERCVPD